MSDAQELTDAQLDALGAAEVANLPAKERKKVRERARRLFERQEAERFAREAAERPAPAAAPELAQPEERAPAAPPEQQLGRDEAQRAGDAAAFLSGVLFPVLALLASWWTPWSLDLARFTDDEAREDGRAWAGVMARYPLLDRLVAWSAPFARVVARVRALATRKETP